MILEISVNCQMAPLASNLCRVNALHDGQSIMMRSTVEHRASILANGKLIESSWSSIILFKGTPPNHLTLFRFAHPFIGPTTSQQNYGFLMAHTRKLLMRNQELRNKLVSFQEIKWPAAGLGHWWFWLQCLCSVFFIYSCVSSQGRGLA